MKILRALSVNLETKKQAAFGIRLMVGPFED